MPERSTPPASPRPADFLSGEPDLSPNSTTGFLTKLWPESNLFRYSKFLGIQMSGVGVLDNAPPFSVPQIYAAGDYQTVPGTGSSQDTFVQRLDDNVDRYHILWHNPTRGNVSTWPLDCSDGISKIHSLSIRVRSVRRMFAELPRGSGRWQVSREERGTRETYRRHRY